MSNFDTLLADLEKIKTEQETLAKSHSEAANATNTDGGNAIKTDDTKTDETKEGDELTKSLGVIKLANGDEVDALDGTLLVKSLLERMDRTDGQIAGVISHLVGTIKSQGEMLKSMSEQINVLGAQGRGRRTVVAITPKNDGTTTLTKSEGEGMTAEQFMLKSEAAWKAEKINGRELNNISVALRMNQPVDPALVSKVMA